MTVRSPSILTRTLALIALLSASTLAPRPLHAQASPRGGDDFTNTGEDLGQYLGAIYKDEVAGIKLAPPAGSRIINRAGIDLVSFVNDARQWGGSVQMVTLKQKTTVGAYLSSTATELSRTLRDVQVLDSRELTFQSHPAGRITLSMQAELGAATGQKNPPAGAAGEVIALYRQQLVVQLADTQFMILTLYAPLKDHDLATTTFEAMLGTFELLDRQELVKRRAAAVDLGKKWLSTLTAESLKPKLNTAPRLFRMKADGADVGFLQFDELEAARDNTKGIKVVVTSRGFKPDGANVTGQYSAYWAYAGDVPAERRLNYSAWENTTKTVLNRPNIPILSQTFWLREIGTSQVEGISRFTDDEIAELKKQREEMLRDKTLSPDKIPPAIVVVPRQTHIHVGYDADRSQPPQRVFDVMIALEHPAVLPNVLDYLWPRTVDLTKKTEMTFVVYNSAAKRLTYRTLSVIGKDHIVINKQPTDCFRCSDEMEPTTTSPYSSTTLWVDAGGKILMMRTSDQSLLIPTSVDDMQRLWAGRIQQPH